MTAGSKCGAAIVRDTDPCPFHDDWHDPPSLGELEELRNHFGMARDVDLLENEPPSDERVALPIAMRAPVDDVEGHVRGHGRLVARRRASDQRA